MEILTERLRTKFEGIYIDYEVKFELTGKLIASKPLIFDLPLNAQKLILGENQEDLKYQIKSFQTLLCLILPLGIHNQGSFFTEELENVYSKINAQLKKERIKLNELYKYCEENSLEYYVHSSHANKNQYPEDFQKIWDNAKDLINNRNTNIKTDSLRFLGYYYPQFGFKIIPLIIPFIKQPNTKRIAYENLEYYIANESLTYLRNELRACKDGQAISGIYKALSKHELKYHEAIQLDLINSYNSVDELSEDSKANIMEALKHYPNQSSIEIGLEILKENKRHSSGRAARILLDLGYSAKNIAEIMIPKLVASDPRESEAAFSILCNSDKFKDHIPSSEELLNVYVKTLEVNQNLNIAYSMPSMMRNNYESTTSSEIIQHLNNQNSNVLEGILILISCLMDESGINTRPFYNYAAKRKYTELLSHEKSKVVENSLRVLQKIGKREKKQDYINLFLNVIDFENNSLNNLYAMRAINHMLPALKFDRKIIPYFNEALKSNNYNYRVEALKGFRYCEDDSIKRSLNYLKDDPSEDVRREGDNLMKEPERVKKSSLVVNLLRFAYMKIKYKGRTPSQGELLMEYLQKEVVKGNQKQTEKIRKYKLK